MKSCFTVDATLFVAPNRGRHCGGSERFGKPTILCRKIGTTVIVWYSNKIRVDVYLPFRLSLLINFCEWLATCVRRCLFADLYFAWIRKPNLPVL
uniref:Uncharacterized protein n=1 Tax=Caenorhabditis japonica TaxID=281687 RepID=A0A8R1IMS7_CAEJA